MKVVRFVRRACAIMYHGKQGEGAIPRFLFLGVLHGYTSRLCSGRVHLMQVAGAGALYGEVLRMNIKRLMYKLQTALCMRGEKIKINQRQSWSEKNERMVTKYVIQKEVFDKKQQRMKYETILESYQAADVVKHLAALLDDGGGGG